ncbi:MAG: hypothetical protein A2096_16510 [Spirochaetes bacterium GWF1_41_5]|nr:MAG: hypothetical protein A2096_16510 [Spirochaetes bacterium GWF1_41_5]HBE04101.1 hypothetical protein [Spirochaetia bacterium]
MNKKIKLLIFSAGILAASCAVKKTIKKNTLSLMVWGTPEQLQLEKRMAGVYEKQHPDIKIEIISVPFRDYDRKLLNLAVSGITPDIIMVNRNFFYKYAQKGVFLALDETVKNENYDLQQFYPLALKSYSWQGKLYGLPRDVSGYVMYYNKDLLEKEGVAIPDNWEEFYRACAKISRDINNDGIFDQYGTIFEWSWVNYLWGLGGDIFDNPVKPASSRMLSKEALQALIYYHSFYKNKFSASRSVINESGRQDLFSTGRIGFFISGYWYGPNLRKIKEFEWDAAIMPQGPKGRFSKHAGTCFSIAAHSKNFQAAWDFLKYYTGEKAVKMSVAGGRTVPAIKTLAGSSFFLDRKPPANTKVFTWSMEAGRQWCYSAGLIEYRELIAEEMEKLSILDITPEEAQKNIHLGLEKIIKESEKE